MKTTVIYMDDENPHEAVVCPHCGDVMVFCTLEEEYNFYKGAWDGSARGRHLHKEDNEDFLAASQFRCVKCEVSIDIQLQSNDPRRPGEIRGSNGEHMGWAHVVQYDDVRELNEKEW